MKEIKETKLVEQVVTKYVAEDGTEFETQSECEEYERRQELELLIKGIERCDSLEDCANFNGFENCEHYAYYWYKPKNRDEIMILSEYYNFDFPQNAEKLIGKWICVEYNRYDDSWVSTLDTAIRYSTYILNTLGYDVQITKKNEN